APMRALDFWLRARGRRAGEHPDGTEVLINVRPVDTLPSPDNLEVLPLLWGGIGQTPRPHERDTDGAAVCKMRCDQVVGDLDGENPGIVTRHNGHAMPPRYAPSFPQ